MLNHDRDKRIVGRYMREINGDLLENYYLPAIINGLSFFIKHLKNVIVCIEEFTSGNVR